jgi:hypothetical protein
MTIALTASQKIVLLDTFVVSIGYMLISDLHDSSIMDSSAGIRFSLPAHFEMLHLSLRFRME